jgi:hypothetical protein
MWVEFACRLGRQKAIITRPLHVGRKHRDGSPTALYQIRLEKVALCGKLVRSLRAFAALLTLLVAGVHEDCPAVQVFRRGFDESRLPVKSVKRVVRLRASASLTPQRGAVARTATATSTPRLAFSGFVFSRLNSIADLGEYMPSYYTIHYAIGRLR